MPVVDRHYDTWISILGNPIVKLYLLVLISLPFFHFAHRLRYLLVDLGVPAAKTLAGAGDLLRRRGGGDRCSRSTCS